jgi:glutathione synthase/RimK-type ligase-like ATP-grasp enzyme
MPKTLIVSDELAELSTAEFNAISFETYLRDYPKKEEPKTRVINLCDSSTYLSQGYYCSLLAEARQHQVMPSVRVINSLRPKHDLLKQRVNVSQFALNQMEGLTTYVFFGHAQDESLSKVARYLFGLFTAPILKVTLHKEGNQWYAELERSSVANLAEEVKPFFYQQLQHFTDAVWRKTEQRKLRWDMAILVNPEEDSPPSNKKALQRFVKAAKKLSINAQLVSKAEITDLSRFDALFIRETTAIDHHTYELAVQAEDLGLVVIDDSQSILRCCNKAFLHDAFSYQKVPTPKTRILHEYTESTADALENEFGFPLVLKMPEGSFSRGVYKVKDASELHERLTDLFQFTALVLVQEFMYTDYDWRIGVLNGRPLYACRYQMVRNHWQIYNHTGKKSVSGGFDTLPTFEVPKPVLDAAIKACKIVGSGLYGVDVKTKNGKPFVLEVNDNPSIEHGVEDGYLGKDLYMQIMAEFQQRLEARGRV